MSIELIQLSPNDGDDVYEMLQHIGPNENAFQNDAFGLPRDRFADWLLLLDAWAHGENLPDGYVRQWTYWLLVDGRPVGYGKIRERLTDESRKSGGNIGYAIDDRFRGKGYGTELMSRLVAKARELGVEERLLTIEKYNYVSKKVVEKCGGELVAENDQRWFFEI